MISKADGGDFGDEGEGNLGGPVCLGGVLV